MGDSCQGFPDLTKHPALPQGVLVWGKWGWEALGFLWSQLSSFCLWVCVCPALQREVLCLPRRRHQEHHQQV